MSTMRERRQLVESFIRAFIRTVPKSLEKKEMNWKLKKVFETHQNIALLKATRILKIAL